MSEVFQQALKLIWITASSGNPLYIGITEVGYNFEDPFNGDYAHQLCRPSKYTDFGGFAISHDTKFHNTSAREGDFFGLDFDGMDFLQVDNRSVACADRYCDASEEPEDSNEY